MKVYYSHPICIKGSARENRELAQIQAEYPDAEIINPSDRRYHWQKATSDMAFFLDLVTQCDVLVYSRLFGHITSGVGLEVNQALRTGIPVYRLEDGVFTRVPEPVTAISRQATRELYQEWWKITPR